MVNLLLLSLLAGALQSPLMQHTRIVVRALTVLMATTPDEARASRINKLEEYLAELEAARDDPDMYGELMDELTRVKREGMTAGSSEWVAVVVEAEQRSEALTWATKQQASQQGQAFIRDRENAERKAVEGLTYGSSEWAVAVDKAATETAMAFRMAKMQKASAREAANRKRAALLGALFADSDSSSGGQLASSVAVDTDAALDAPDNGQRARLGGATAPSLSPLGLALRSPSYATRDKKAGPLRAQWGDALWPRVPAKVPNSAPFEVHHAVSQRRTARWIPTLGALQLGLRCRGRWRRGEAHQGGPGAHEGAHREHVSRAAAKP